jgi:hypothetical protein
VAATVGQFYPFEQVPDPFVGIEFWGVAWEPLQLQPGGRTGAQKCLHLLAAMDRGAVPDDQQFAPNLAEQLAQEGDHRRPTKRVLLDMSEQPSVWGQPTDGRQVVPRQGQPQDRCLPAGRVGAGNERQQIESGFVYKDDGPLLRFGFALREGQRSSRKAAIAASSRWVARRIGFCTVHPIWRKRRLTCAEW